MKHFKRDSTWHMVLPGLYVDPHGYGHVFPDEVIAELQTRYPGIRWNLDEDINVFLDALKEAYAAVRPGYKIEFAMHEREKH
jgi:hypothetical protein